MAFLVPLLAFGALTASAAASVQVADQSADNEQQAQSSATSTQKSPSNRNISVRVMSPGDDGDVTQVNASDALSSAANDNQTDQRGSQSQGAGGGVQRSDQDAGSEQGARSNATSTQDHPSNTNVSVRVMSPGDGGAVKQVNASGAKSKAANDNHTNQAASQSQGGGAGGVQTADQDAHNKQDARSEARSEQDHPSNKNVSVRVDSPGDDGEVEQINESTAKSAAENENETSQSVEQDQPGGRDMTSRDCGGCGGPGGGIQTADQGADSRQKAASSAESHQIAPCNCARSVRVGSPGDNGDVSQVNASKAVSKALNSNATDQSANQSQGGGGDVGVQALGQHASNAQHGESAAESHQDHPRNGYSSVRVDSPGGGGDVHQANLSAALSAAVNDNRTRQVAEQDQATGGVAVQALGQKAHNKQEAASDARSRQDSPCNCYHPLRVKSPGDDGDVDQANLSLAGSVGLNENATDQAATQRQRGGGSGSDCSACGGSRPDGGDSQQDGGDSVPDVPGCDGCSGSGVSGAERDGTSVGGCGCGAGVSVQALGQKTRNGQGARSGAQSEQDGPSNGADPLRLKSAGGLGELMQLNGSFGGSHAGNGNGTRQGARQLEGAVEA